MESGEIISITIFIKDLEDDDVFLQYNWCNTPAPECKGLKIKSSHKIRKTNASMLNAAGVPLDEIREQLGHTNLYTTLGYIYNPLTAKDTYQLMSKAL